MRSKQQSEILYEFNLPSTAENNITVKIYEPVLFAADLVLPVEIEGLPNGQSGIFNKAMDVEKLRSLLAVLEGMS